MTAAMLLRSSSEGRTRFSSRRRKAFCARSWFPVCREWRRFPAETTTPSRRLRPFDIVDRDGFVIGEGRRRSPD